MEGVPFFAMGVSSVVKISILEFEEGLIPLELLLEIVCILLIMDLLLNVLNAIGIIGKKKKSRMP
jgi:hypothetical protein